MADDPYSAEELGKRLIRFSEDPYDHYWYWLGKFVHIFAEAENRLVSRIQREAKVSNEIAGVLFNSTRIDGGRDTLNRLFEATGQAAAKEWLEPFLTQLKAIGTTRNNIIHWGAKIVGENELIVSNAARYPAKPKEFLVTPNDLEKMCSDLQRIIFALMLDESTAPSAKDRLNAYLSTPWLYMPPQPYPPENQTHPNPQSPKRQPRASRKSR